MEVRGAQIFKWKKKFLILLVQQKAMYRTGIAYTHTLSKFKWWKNTDFSIFRFFFMLLDRFLLSQHRKIERFCCIYHPRTRATQPNSSEKPMKKSKNRKIHIFPPFEFL